MAPPKGNPGGNQLATGESNPKKASTSKRATRQSNNQQVSQGVISNCQLCNEKVGEDAIGCDSCGRWYHPKTLCTGLSNRAITCIQEEGGQSIRFICSVCRCQPASTETGVVSQEAFTQLYEMVKSLAQSVALLTTKIDQQISSPASTTPNPLSNRKDLFLEMHEFDERKKRKESLIVKGITASNSQEFTHIFNIVSRTIVDKVVTPDNIFKIPNQTNMFRIKIQNEELRKEILSNANKLRDNKNYKDVYISRDLTYQQRQEMKARRDIRKSKNDTQEKFGDPLLPPDSQQKNN